MDWMDDDEHKQPDAMAQHSTQHSTAQHSTAQKF
jgi:hypothetical protein